MSIEKKDIDRITGLSKSDFEKKLSEAVKSAGVDPLVSIALLRDSEKIKNALGSLSEKEIAQLSEVLKNNNLGNIEKIIKNGLGD